MTMTEKEKMLRGMLYYADDSALCADRVRAKELCHAYNQLRPSDAAGMRELLQQLLGKTGETFCVTAPFGEHVFVAPNCGFYTAGHPIDAECRERGLEYAYPITVGDHVWIGGGVQVMPGVTIGSNVVIGGGSVVVKDIPSDSVAVGNPCRVIRPITEADKQTCWDR